MAPRRADPFKKAFKYRFTELPPNAISTALSSRWLKRRLAELGFADFHLEIVGHHAAHASAAAACSGFPEALILTLDGVGDGLSGSLWRWEEGALKLLKALPAPDLPRDLLRTRDEPDEHARAGGRGEGNGACQLRLPDSRRGKSADGGDRD